MKNLLICLLCGVPSITFASTDVCVLEFDAKAFEKTVESAEQVKRYLEWQGAEEVRHRSFSDERPRPAEYADVVERGRTSLRQLELLLRIKAEDLAAQRLSFSSRVRESTQLWRQFNAVMDGMKSVEARLSRISADSLRRAAARDVSVEKIVRDVAPEEQRTLMAFRRFCLRIDNLMNLHSSVRRGQLQTFDCVAFARSTLAEWPDAPNARNEPLRMATLADLFGRDWNVGHARLTQQNEEFSALRSQVQRISDGLRPFLTERSE